MKKHNIGGFTLLELLVVITIIGILVGLATVNFQGARERARDVQRKSDLSQMRNALELYKNDRNPPAYPSDLDDLVTGGYIKTAPEDPLHQQTPAAWPDYAYTLNSSLEYDLVACLENTSDSDKDATNVCASGWSYTLTEP